MSPARVVLFHVVFFGNPCDWLFRGSVVRFCLGEAQGASHDNAPYVHIFTGSPCQFAYHGMCAVCIHNEHLRFESD